MPDPRSPGVMRAELKRYRFHSAPAAAGSTDPASRRQRAAWYAKEALLLEELQAAISREFEADIHARLEARDAALAELDTELQAAYGEVQVWHQAAHRHGEELQTVDFTNGARSSLRRPPATPVVTDREKLDGFIGEKALEGRLHRRVPAKVELDKATLNKLLRPKEDLDGLEPGTEVPAVMEDYDPETGVVVVDVPGISYVVQPMKWTVR